MTRFQHHFRQRARRRQSGFMLGILAFVLVILSMIAAKKQYEAMQEQLDLQAVAQGKALATVGKAGTDYVVNYYAQLDAMATPGDPISVTVGSGPGALTVNIAQGDRPTIAEMVQLGLLPTNYSQRAPIGGNYVYQIRKTPAGCTSQCNLEGEVWVDVPYRTNGRIDTSRAGIVVKTIGADGAMSTASAPANLSGYGGKWAVPNPVLPSSAGIIAMRFGYASSVNSQFYRRDGSLPLTGPMNAAGNSISNVSTFMATGSITGDQFVPGAKTAGTACTTANAIASGAGLVLICDGGTWKVYKGLTATPGAACSPEGTRAVSVVNGEDLFCKNGVYVRMVNLITRNPEISRQLVMDGTVVAKPTCDTGGTPDYSFHLIQTAVDVTITPPKQAMYITTNDLGGSWQVVLRLRDDVGGENSGNLYNLRAIMRLECRY